MINKIRKINKYCLIFILISVFWILLEIIIDGKREPNVPDTIIGLLFAWSVYRNITKKTR